jgi:serine/threonine protein kinase
MARSRGYIVMEKIEGQSVLNYVYENGPVNEEIAKSIIREVISGV